jgi:hypothetical protein
MMALRRKVLRFLFFWDVMQRTLVIADVFKENISPIFNGQAVLEDP